MFITNTCTHNCKLCCNKQYDINKIPVVTVEELQNAEMVCITGGEPFLLEELNNFIINLRDQYPNIKQLYIYTCGDSLSDWFFNPKTYENYIPIDGVNISPKNKFDIYCICQLFKYSSFKRWLSNLSSSRLYLFPNIDKEKFTALNLEQHPTLHVIDREWQEEFTSNSGIFRRLPILF